MSWVIVLVVISSFLLGGGAIVAADDAVPGDMLYRLDLSLEELRLTMTTNPAERLSLYLASADERLQEVAVLADEGADEAQLAGLLQAYAGAMDGATRAVSGASDVDQETLLSILDEASATYDAELDDLLATTAVSSTAGTFNAGVDCTGVILHPRGQSLAAQYEVPYEEIMDWFCSGFGFGEIGRA
ncbi:MAG: hypothetical protein KC413_22735 [Anaerolineales bacterium]|nr:hypothetical protein [Anaerolineales bacterium]